MKSYTVNVFLLQMETLFDDVDYSGFTNEELVNNVIKPLKYINTVQTEHIKENTIRLNTLKTQLELLFENFKDYNPNN